jgi:hypothetical protein
MLIYSSDIDIFSINCVQFNILFEFDICVLSRLFDMSSPLYYKTLRINVRENRRGNQQWTIQRNWQHWIHKTQDEDKQIKNTTQHALNTTMSKHTEIT